MSGSDTEQEHPSDCFSGPPAKGLELSFTTTHNNLFSKVVLLPKTKAQAGCGCSTNLQTPSSVLPNGKPDTDWQSGCWCLPPKESVWMRGECNGIPPAISSVASPWTLPRSLQFQAPAGSQLRSTSPVWSCTPAIAFKLWPLIGSQISSNQSPHPDLFSPLA